MTTKSKARNAKMVGQQVIHMDYGLVVITSAVAGSFTKVNFRVIQRGAGWDEIREQYRPVMRTRPNPEAGKDSRTIYFDLTRRDQYGLEDIAHVDELEDVE